jgi:hypothetical protein
MGCRKLSISPVPIRGDPQILQNYLHKAPHAGNKERERHTAWGYINCLNIAGLVVMGTYANTAPPILVMAVFIILALITVYDLLKFGTLQRVRDALP